MRIHISARHLKLTKSLKSYVEEKAGKAQRYFDHIIWAQVVLEVEKKAHTCEIVIHASRQTFRALARGVDLYAAVDLASDRIDAQLRKFKEKIRNHHKEIEPAPLAAAALNDGGELPVVQFSIVKQVAMRPMSREEAAEEMDRLGYAFWMFMEKDSGQVHVIYRRMDDSYGLLQPVHKRK
jgi:ribosome hibernation promoting factor